MVKLGEVLVVKAKLRSGSLDIRGRQFTAVYNSFFERATEAAVETIGDDLGRRFIADVRARLVGWGDKATPFKVAGV